MFLLSARKAYLGVQYGDDRWSHLESTKSLSGVQRHLLILSVETLPARLEVLHWDLHSLRFVLASEWVLGIRGLFLTFSCTICYNWEYKFLPFVASILLLHWFFEDGFPMRASLPIPPHLQPEYVLSKFPRDLCTSEGIFLAKLSCQIDEALTGLVQTSYKIQPLHKKRITGPLNGSPNRFSLGFFLICLAVLDTSQIAKAFHGFSPTFFIQAR